MEEYQTLTDNMEESNHIVFATVVIVMGMVFASLIISTGYAEMGQQIKYGETRAACISQQLTAEQCADWNNKWENLVN